MYDLKHNTVDATTHEGAVCPASPNRDVHTPTRTRTLPSIIHRHLNYIAIPTAPKSQTRMSQSNRYPSPEPGNSSHPYHQTQQPMAPDVAQNIQPAPTAMMQEPTGDTNQMPQGFQFISQYGQQPNTPQQAQHVAQQSLEVNGSETDPTKKRNKVSRACDECRRKKVQQ